MRAQPQAVNAPNPIESMENHVPRSAGSGGTLTLRLSGAAWKVMADFFAALRSVSFNWVSSTPMRALASASPVVAAMAYHL